MRYRPAMPFFAYPGPGQTGTRVACGGPALDAINGIAGGGALDAINGIAGGGAKRWRRRGAPATHESRAIYALSRMAAPRIRR
jgi:hypothetical protein